MALTPKQQTFVDEYLVDLNATQAAVRAGYSPRTAGPQGARLLANVNVAAAIQEAQATRSQRTEITQDWVLQGLKTEAERDGEGSSHGARVSAYKAVGQHLGMFESRPPLELILASLPAAMADAVRAALAAELSAQRDGPGGAAGPA